MGSVGILNVGAGDVKLVFDRSNPAEMIRAARIVKDMLRRGYALLVQVEENGETVYRRAEDFDETKCEYIIADFDPVAAAVASPGTDDLPSAEAGDHAGGTTQDKAIRKPGRPRKRVLDAATTTAVAVSRTAGG